MDIKLIAGVWVATGKISWDSMRLVCNHLLDLEHQPYGRKQPYLPLTLWLVERCHKENMELGPEMAGISGHLYAAMARIELIAGYYDLEDQEAIYRYLIS